MKNYSSKDNLKEAINQAYNKYIAEFDNISEKLKDYKCKDLDRTPTENLAYQVGWTTLILNGRMIKNWFRS